MIVAIPFRSQFLQPNTIWNHSIPRFFLNRTRGRNRPMTSERNHSIPFLLVLEPNTSLVSVHVHLREPAAGSVPCSTSPSTAALSASRRLALHHLRRRRPPQPVPPPAHVLLQPSLEHVDVIVPIAPAGRSSSSPCVVVIGVGRTIHGYAMHTQYVLQKKFSIYALPRPHLSTWA
jgi:hypothetical protein